MHKKIGHYSFLVGVALAIVAGILFMGADPTITTILVILGLIVGFLNVKAKETTEFLVVAVVLVVAGGANLGIIPVIGSYLQSIVAYIVVFVAPAAIVVALKAVPALARK